MPLAPTIAPPTPETMPTPSVPAGPTDPMPDSPLRRSPRPDRQPNPSTDPKQFLARLLRNYFGPQKGTLRAVAATACPLRMSGSLDRLIGIEARDIGAQARGVVAAHNPAAIMQSIESLESEIRPQILGCIDDYARSVFGGLYDAIRTDLDTEYEHNNTNTVRTILKLADAGIDDSASTELTDSTEFLADTVRRAEVHSLLIQGASIRLMQAFPAFARSHLPATLCDTYDAFYLLSRIGHYQAFRMQMEGESPVSPITPEHSLGESDVCYEPVLRPDNPTEIVGMRAHARATSHLGIVLLHEVIKASLQLLTVWAKVRENYLTRQEWLALRLLVNSPFAEIRQFVVGPAFLERTQTAFTDAGLPVGSDDPEFYRALQEWVGGEVGTFDRMLGKGNDS